MDLKANKQMTGTDSHEERLLSIEKSNQVATQKPQRGQGLSEFITAQDLVHRATTQSYPLTTNYWLIGRVTDKIHLKSRCIKKKTEKSSSWWAIERPGHYFPLWKLQGNLNHLQTLWSIEEEPGGTCFYGQYILGHQVFIGWAVISIVRLHILSKPDPSHLWVKAPLHRTVPTGALPAFAHLTNCHAFMTG